MRLSRPGFALFAVGVGLATSGCRQTAAARLSSPDPSERAAAIVAVTEAGDAAAVHKLVDLLEDRDHAVRMYAIMALTRLCGTDYGYHHFDPEPQRAEAVERWRDALRDGRVTVIPRGSQAPEDRPPPALSPAPDGDDAREAPQP